MKTINVEGLPEHVVQTLENMVRTLRQEFEAKEFHDEAEKPTELPAKRGTVYGTLSRREIYENVG